MFRSKQRIDPSLLRALLLLGVVGGLALGKAGRAADVFLLKNGGRVEGELLNRDESPRKTYQVKIGPDQEVTLDPAQVAQADIQSAEAWQYERLVPKMPPTAEGHWKMAEWCRAKKLPDKAQYHLEQVVRLDPEHERARRQLGYSRVDGQWVKADELRREQGYQRFEGRWRVEQDVESMKRREEQEKAEVEWKRKIRLWRGWMGRRRFDEAREKLMAVDDPRAAPALVELLERETDQRVRSLYVEVLGRLPSDLATAALVRGALEDASEEMRLQCVDQLERRGDQEATGAFVRALASEDNQRVNRAAVGLGRLKIEWTIPYLIDALTTTHRKRIDAGSGQIGAAFGRDGTNSSGLGGLSVGGGPKVIEQSIENRNVLDALVAISGGVNYRYDKLGWRQWYSDQSTPNLVNLRRGQ
jgi:hypothetical protein